MKVPYIIILRFTMFNLSVSTLVSTDHIDIFCKYSFFKMHFKYTTIAQSIPLNTLMLL